MPNMAAITNLRNLVPTWMLKTRRRQRATEGGEGADHGLGDQAFGLRERSLEELAQLIQGHTLEDLKASTSGGLITLG